MDRLQHRHRTDQVVRHRQRHTTAAAIAAVAVVASAASAALVALVASAASAAVGVGGAITTTAGTAGATTTAFSMAAKSGKATAPARTVQLWRIRTGDDGAFDRVVFDERLGRSAYTVLYVAHPTADPSGLPLAVRGRAFLEVVLRSTTTAAAPGRPTALRTTLTTRLDEVVQVRKAGEFEAVVTYVIGLHERHPFRVVTLRQPYRLAVDVRH